MSSVLGLAMVAVLLASAVDTLAWAVQSRRAAEDRAHRMHSHSVRWQLEVPPPEPPLELAPATIGPVPAERRAEPARARAHGERRARPICAR